MERLGQPYESRLKRFLKYIEIQTKITSVLPFLMTLAYLFAGSRHIEPLKTLIFFAGMLLFDLTATTINNYSDTKKNHQVLQFKRSTALLINSCFIAAECRFRYMAGHSDRYSLSCLRRFMLLLRYNLLLWSDTPFTRALW